MTQLSLGIAPSSSIAAARYDDETMELEIDFTTGRTYKYSGVPHAIVDGLQRAPSAGRFWKLHRDRFPYEEI